MSIANPAPAIGALPENLQIRCQSTTLPQAQEETNKVELQGHVINYVGKTTKNGEIPMVFVEGTDALAIGYFTKWQQARWSGDGKDTTGVQRLTKDLKADIKIELMGPDDVVTQTYMLIGAMPPPEKTSSHLPEPKHRNMLLLSDNPTRPRQQAIYKPIFS